MLKFWAARANLLLLLSFVADKVGPQSTKHIIKSNLERANDKPIKRKEKQVAHLPLRVQIWRARETIFNLSPEEAIAGQTKNAQLPWAQSVNISMLIVVAAKVRANDMSSLARDNQLFCRR